MSSQIGWPEGASAECGRDRPSASATTWLVAAVPRNWQPPPGDGAGPAAQLGGLLQGDLAVGEAGADGLDLAGVLAVGGRQRHAAGHEDAGQVALAGQGHHHGRQALVAGGHAQHAAAGGQRADQAAQHDGGVVAVGQAVHHARRALGAAVARVGDEAGEGDGAQPAEFLGGRLHEQARLPSGRCGSPGRRACRRARGCRPGC